MIKPSRSGGGESPAAEPVAEPSATLSRRTTKVTAQQRKAGARSHDVGPDRSRGSVPAPANGSGPDSLHADGRSAAVSNRRVTPGRSARAVPPNQSADRRRDPERTVDLHDPDNDPAVNLPDSSSTSTPPAQRTEPRLGAPFVRQRELRDTARLHTRLRLRTGPAAIVARALAVVAAAAAPRRAVRGRQPATPAAGAETAAAATSRRPTTRHACRAPRTTRRSATSFTKGYDQRAVVENGRLNIYDPPSKGGKLLRSTADRSAAGRTVQQRRPGRHAAVVARRGRWPTSPTRTGLASVYLAWTPDALYMAGSHNVGAGAGSDVNRVLPQLALQAAAGRHLRVEELRDRGRQAARLIYSHTLPFIERTEGVTALAVGQVEAKTFVAIGSPTPKPVRWTARW